MQNVTNASTAKKGNNVHVQAMYNPNKKITIYHHENPRLTHEKSITNTLKENFKQEVIGISAFMAFSLQAKLAFILFEQINSDMPDNSEILTGIILAHTALVLVESNVRNPMQAVFYTPMASHGVCKYFNIS